MKKKRNYFNYDIWDHKKIPIKLIRGTFVFNKYKGQIIPKKDSNFYEELRYLPHPLDELLTPKDKVNIFITESLNFEVENKKLRENLIQLQKEVQIIRNKLNDNCNQVIDFQTFYS